MPTDLSIRAATARPSLRVSQSSMPVDAHISEPQSETISKTRQRTRNVTFAKTRGDPGHLGPCNASIPSAPHERQMQKMRNPRSCPEKQSHSRFSHPNNSAEMRSDVRSGILLFLPLLLKNATRMEGEGRVDHGDSQSATKPDRFPDWLFVLMTVQED